MLDSILYDIKITLRSRIGIYLYSPRACNRLNQVAEAKRFEGVFYVETVC